MAYDDLLVSQLDLSPVVIPTNRRGRVRLSSVDVLFVPWAPDAEWLTRNRTHLRRYVERGGLVVAFGEFENDWLPNLVWAKTVENTVSINEGTLTPEGQRARKKIFAGLTAQDLHNWEDSCHGYFTTIGDRCDVLILSATGRPAAVLDCDSYSRTGGAILASSVDADFHTYGGIDAAKTMFRQTVEWAVEFVATSGGYRGRTFTFPSFRSLRDAISKGLPPIVVEFSIGLFVFVLSTAVIWTIRLIGS
jgi:hypothetical protein